MIKTLENDKLSVSFDDSTCGIVSLKNKLSGDDYVKSGSVKIFSLSCLDSEKNMVNIEPDSVEDLDIFDDGCSKVLNIQFYKQDIKVKASLSLGDSSDKIEWHIDVENNSTCFDIVEILFPRIRGISLGETYRDDIIIYPHHAGEKTQNPVEEYLKPCFTELSRAAVKKDGDIYFREINYCGLASMMWMYYYDDKNGFYISSYDDDFYLTSLRIETGGPKNPWMGFAIRKYLTVKRGCAWHSKPYITAVNCDDWHWGSKEYRKWINQYVNMPQNPRYLDDEYVLMNMYKFRREGQVYYRFKDIPYLFDIARDYGINHFFMAGWNRQGFDQNYPEYYPDMELGTSMDLYNGCKYINDMGGVPTFYINARIFDVNSDYSDTMGKRMAIKQHGGNMINEQYGEYRFTVSCPSDAEWQKLIIDTAYWMVKSYRAKGMYLDQLGSAEPYPCYDSNHTHDDIGLFNKGYLNILKTLKESLYELDRDTFLMIENCGDIYGSYIWGNLTWNGEIRDEYFDLYKYTFPEYVQVNMINPQEMCDKELRAKQYYSDVERALTLGSVLWVNPLVKFHEGDEELLDYLRKAVEFRKQANPYIVKSRFVDNDGILSVSVGLKVTRWVGQDGAELYIAGNNEGLGGYFEIPERLCDFKAYEIDKGFADVSYEKTGGRIRVAVPEGRMSFVAVIPKGGK